MVVSTFTRRQKRTVLSLTTRFCLPHEGMTQLEFLSRGSAFLLDSAASPASASTATAPPRLHDLKVLTCQHVACPWLFPNYFEEKWDWLQHVSEEFVQHSLQLLEIPADDVDTKAASFRPRVLVDIPLTHQVWLHPDRDVALLAINEQDELRWNEVVDQWQLEALTLNPARSKPGELLLFSGHKQLIDGAQDKDAASETSSAASTSGDEEDEEDELDARDAVDQYPKQVYGRFVGQSARGQAFAWSEEILEEGMCGGAVVNQAGDCVGLVEGIVPAYKPTAARAAAALSAAATQEERQAAAAAAATARMQKALENHVAFVPAVDLVDFVKDGASQSLLTGLGLDF